jgi:hypothetical protein
LLPPAAQAQVGEWIFTTFGLHLNVFRYLLPTGIGQAISSGERMNHLDIVRQPNLLEQKRQRNHGICFRDEGPRTVDSAKFG